MMLVTSSVIWKETAMDNPDLAMHYVCTHEKARQLVQTQQRFWVSNCGCRESRADA
jgi:hypothetical protein